MLGDVAEHTCPTCGREQWHKHFPEEQLVRDHDIDCVIVFYRLLVERVTPRQRELQRALACQFMHERGAGAMVVLFLLMALLVVAGAFYITELIFG